MIAILVESALRSLLLGLVAWLGLRQRRARNPQTEATVWLTVLAASLATPFLLHWPILHVSVASAVLPAALSNLGLPGIGQPVPGDAATIVQAPASVGLTLGAALLPGLYLAVAGTLLLRLAVGLLGTWRIARQAPPIHGGWTQGLDVRVTDAVETPVSFGRTVLLPLAWLDWPLPKRRAVISHERAHIENHDFIVQLIARIHTAIFWFSPLAWWLQLRLAFLAERTSDEAATAALGSRIDYAEILLDIALGGRGLPEAIAMARPALLHRRVESLLSRSATGFTLAPRRRLMLVLALLPSVLVIAGTAWHARAADLTVLGRAGSHVTTLPGAPNFVLRQHGRIETNAGSSAVERMRAAQGSSGDALLFEEDGAIYAVTESELLDRAEELLDTVGEAADAGQQQAEIGRQRAEIGRQHGEIGRQQGQIGRQMGELASDHARHGVSDADYHEAMAALQQQMDELSKGHERLGLEEAQLSIEQEQVKQQRQGHDAGQVGGKLAALLDQARRDGIAVKIGGR
jgi:beta-lactamase regulating signal transducer with metallopeptidase domain